MNGELIIAMMKAAYSIVAMVFILVFSYELLLQYDDKHSGIKKKVIASSILSLLVIVVISLNVYIEIQDDKRADEASVREEKHANEVSSENWITGIVRDVSKADENGQRSISIATGVDEKAKTVVLKDAEGIDNYDEIQVDNILVFYYDEKNKTITDIDTDEELEDKLSKTGFTE